MARPRREVAHPNIADAIKRIARQQMSERGTAGLSLRAIARELAITAPAIYNYYPRLDDLITALIVDAFQSLADAMQASVSTLDEQGYRARILAMSLAYRQWAIEHPTDFQLIYGNLSGCLAAGGTPDSGRLSGCALKHPGACSRLAGVDRGRTAGAALLPADDRLGAHPWPGAARTLPPPAAHDRRPGRSLRL
jgi:AcrR family transcriptional regulator